MERKARKLHRKKKTTWYEYRKGEEKNIELMEIKPLSEYPLMEELIDDVTIA